MPLFLKHRRRRKQQLEDYEGKRISNPTYLDTRNANNNGSSGIPNEGMDTSASGMPDITEANDYSNIELPDNEYNEMKCEIDDEYNRVNFTNSPIPFDDNYGHINATNNIVNDYDHIKGMQLTDTQSYSKICQQRTLPKDADETNTTLNAHPNDRNKSSDKCSATYDHLGQTNEYGKPNDDQDNEYSHIHSGSN